MASGVCQQVLHDEDIDDWPACSSDLNLIQHLWDLMYRSVYSCRILPQTVQGLNNALIQVWEEIPQKNVQMM